MLAIAEALGLCLAVSLLLRAPMFFILATAYLIGAGLFIAVSVAFPLVGVTIVAVAALGSLMNLERRFYSRR